MGKKNPPKAVQSLVDDGDKLPVLNSRALAWLAESADGKRDVELVLIKNKNGKLQLIDRSEQKTEPVILRIRTPSTEPTRAHVKAEKFKLNPEWDAIFLSESAVEKFVFPYYEAQRLLTRKEFLHLKKMFYTTEDAIGLAHIHPSRSFLLLSDGSTVPVPVGSGIEFDINQKFTWWDE